MNEPGLVSTSVTEPDFGQLWSTTLPGTTAATPNQVYAQPLVVDGMVIVVTEENEVVALNPISGAVDLEQESRHAMDPDPDLRRPAPPHRNDVDTRLRPGDEDDLHRDEDGRRGKSRAGRRVHACPARRAER